MIELGYFLFAYMWILAVGDFAMIVFLIPMSYYAYKVIKELRG